MSKLFGQPQSVLDWVWLLAVTAISPAVCEEALFRGFLFSSLRQRVPAWALIALTAVGFGFFHLSIYRMLGTTLLGALMGWLVYKGGSIFPSMLFHALNNASAIVVVTWVAPATESLPAWLFIAGGVGTIIGGALLWPERSPFAKAAQGVAVGRGPS
jgi:membrane protease YdiL (CAAX protease family)